MRVARGVSKNICVIYVFLETNTHTLGRIVVGGLHVSTFTYVFMCVVCRRRS